VSRSTTWPRQLTGKFSWESILQTSNRSLNSLKTQETT
jgi:hypothetical protein